jgi:hypothetical protein
MVPAEARGSARAAAQAWPGPARPSPGSRGRCCPGQARPVAVTGRSPGRAPHPQAGPWGNWGRGAQVGAAQGWGRAPRRAAREPHAQDPWKLRPRGRGWGSFCPGTRSGGSWLLPAGARAPRTPDIGTL